MRTVILSLAILIGSATIVHARGADGVDTTAAAAADRGYRDGVSASTSSDHEGSMYGRSGTIRSAYDNGWKGGVYKNGWLDAFKDFFAKGLKYDRSYQGGYGDGKEAAAGGSNGFNGNCGGCGN